MREVLEPLALIPGVHLTAMVSSDGVPIATLNGLSERGTGGSTTAALDADTDLGSLAAQVAGWVGEIDRAVGQLAWNPPERMVLRASQGAIVLQRGPNALLLVWLDSNIGADELRVPMDGAVARMQRLLRSVGTAPHPTGGDSVPPGALPSDSTLSSEPSAVQPSPLSDPGQNPQ